MFPDAGRTVIGGWGLINRCPFATAARTPLSDFFFFVFFNFILFYFISPVSTARPVLGDCTVRGAAGRVAVEPKQIRHARTLCDFEARLQRRRSRETIGRRKTADPVQKQESAFLSR